MKTKICSKCNIEKPLSEFYKDKRATDGLNCQCNKCQNKATIQSRNKNLQQYKDYNKKYNELHKEENHQYYIDNKNRWRTLTLFRKFGITLNEYNELLKKQNGVCAICGNKETKQRNNIFCMLAVDHDHKTGKVRGLLCNNCNRAIGLLSEKIQTLQTAINYLNGNQNNDTY